MLANLRALLAVSVDIVLLRRGPENLPASALLLAIVVTSYVVLYAIGYYAVILPRLPAASNAWPLEIVLGALLTLTWFYLACRMTGKPERFVQTMIAVFATNTLFTPAVVPLIGAVIPYLAQPNTPAPPLLALTGLVVFIWLLAALTRIVRAAFEWTWPGSIVFVITGNIASAIFLAALFGETAPVA